MSTLRIALAQINLTVGDIEGNAAKIVRNLERARGLRVDVLLFPELTLTGYPPEDLLFHSGLRKRVETALESIRDSVRDIAVLVGFPDYGGTAGDAIFNACVVFKDGEVLVGEVAKRQAITNPNQTVRSVKRHMGTDWSVKLNGRPSIAVAIYQLPGSNSLEVANAVNKLMKKLQKGQLNLLLKKSLH